MNWLDVGIVNNQFHISPFVVVEEVMLAVVVLTLEWIVVEVVMVMVVMVGVVMVVVEWVVDMVSVVVAREELVELGKSDSQIACMVHW